MADIVIKQIEEGMTGRQVADLLYQNFLALLNAGVDVDDLREYFLNKDREETARYLLTFLAGIKVGDAVDGMLGGRGTIATADGRVQTDIMQLRKALTIGRQGFAEGMTGYGGRVDADGNAELESLVLRRFLEVPELRYRRTEVIVGDKWRAAGGGVIERVEPILNNGQPTGEGYIWLKLEDGEIGAIAPNDICMGIFHDYKNKANNATADADDGKGNRTFAGFCTVYFRIEEVSDVTDESGTHVKKLARYSIRPTSATWEYSHEPMEQMTFVVYGNFADANRQTSVYETRTYTRMLKNQNSWEFGYHNIALQYGDFKNIGEAFGRPVADGYALFVGSIYMAGTLTQVTASGEEVRAVVDRGAWTAGTTAGYYERFSYDGSLWLCVDEGGTTSAPSATEPAWLLQVAAGASITSDNDWKSKNTPYKVNTIVPFAGRMFITTEETSNPPMGLLTDESGTYITDEAGGYLIVDEATSAGWQLLLDISGITNGEDGASVEVQWSKDGNNWHAAYADGDLYMRQRVGDAAWGAAIRVVGEDGKDGYNQTFEFAVSNSLTEQPLDGWSDAPRPVGSGEYLWMRTGTIMPPATRPATWTVVRIGGERGADGVGINSVTISYGKSNSIAIKPTTWSNELPVVGENEVLWVRTITDYTDETKADTVSYMYSYQGKTGAAGTSVSVVSIEYQAGASATSAPTGTWSEDVVQAVDGMYLWTRTTFSDGSVAYGISKQGKDGQDGADGKDGKDGKDGADGKDGQGFAPRGEWATAKMPAKVGDVFRMGGAAWVAVRETSNPPMWTLTDEEGNRLMREDGGYLLTGEVNAAEWDMWVEDGTQGPQGEKGDNGADGKDGKDGAQGPQGYAGAVTRTWQGWENGRKYRNDVDALPEELEPDGVRYKDFVLVENSAIATGYDVYECLVTNVGINPANSEYDANGVSTGGHWRMATNMAAAFVTSFVALNANIKFAASGQLAILDENNKVCAGMAGTQAGKRTRIWAGGDNPDEAPFRVDQMGETWLENAHITGEVNATSGNFDGVVIKGNLRTPWKKISANPIVDANSGNLRYEFLGNTITDDKLILNSMVGATLKIAWLADADGREIAIYNQVPLIGSGGGGDVKIIIPSGCSIVTSEAIYEDEYTLKAGYLYYLSGLYDMWVVKQVVNIQKLY